LGTTLSMVTASGIVDPSTCVSVTIEHKKSESRCYDYYMGRRALAQSTYLLPW
jgi:hypothetical protein